MTTLAVLVGGLTGFGTGVFRILLDGLFQLTVEGIGSRTHLALIFLPALGGLMVAGWLALIHREGERGLGVAGIMESVALHGGRIGLVGSVARIIGAIFTVGLGGSAGPEDPSVQIGATLGSQLGQWLRLAEGRVRTLVGCGCAAGIGAAFNAPISGVFFAIEIILGESSGNAIGYVVLASVSGAVVVQTLLGKEPAFQVVPYELLKGSELGLYALLGLAAAIVSVLYIRVLEAFERGAEKWTLPAWIQPAVGGLGVGLLAFFVRPEILGTGYPAIAHVLHGDLNLAGTLFILVGLKLLATPMTIGTGGQGGLFAPSLFLGAMLGVGFGVAAHHFLPGIADPPAYGLVGMGAVLAGAVRAPITAIMLPFEMTRDYMIVLPLMLATAVSTSLASLMNKESVYTSQHKLLGIDLKAHKNVDLMRTITVEEAMMPFSEMTTVTPTTTAEELARLFQTTSRHGIVVLDDDGELFGIVALSDLERTLELQRTDLLVGDFCTRNVTVSFPDDTLEDALRNFGTLDVGRMPVVERRHPRRVLGYLGRTDVIHAYSHALLERQQQDNRVARLRLESAVGAKLVELDLHDGHQAVGKRLKELQLPPEAVIVSIRRGRRVVVPRGDTQLKAHDCVIALCNPDSVPQLRRTLAGEESG